MISIQRGMQQEDPMQDSSDATTRIDRLRMLQAEGGLKGQQNALPTIGVAFGGGGARGLAHIHVIEVLDELGLKPVAISGASIGAIMGAGMASGMTGRDIRAFALSAIGNPADAWGRLWKSRRPLVKPSFGEGGFRLGQFNIERILNAFLPEAIPQHFEDLVIPLKVVVTDYYDQTERVCASGDLRNALAASAAIPAIFRPVRRSGRVMVDGGIINPVPFDHLRDQADIIIGIDVVGSPAGDPKRLPSTVDSMFGATQLMMQSIIRLQLKVSPPDILIKPDVGQFRVLEFFKAEKILKATEGIRDELKRSLDTLIEEKLSNRV